MFLVIHLIRLQLYVHLLLSKNHIKCYLNEFPRLFTEYANYQTYYYYFENCKPDLSHYNYNGAFYFFLDISAKSYQYNMQNSVGQSILDCDTGYTYDATTKIINNYNIFNYYIILFINI